MELKVLLLNVQSKTYPHHSGRALEAVFYSESEIVRWTVQEGRYLHVAYLNFITETIRTESGHQVLRTRPLFSRAFHVLCFGNSRHYKTIHGNVVE